MHSSSVFVFFGLLSALQSGVLAFGTLYRCDKRNFATIKAAGGFKSKGSDTATQENLFKHVDGWSYPNDPFISTTTMYDCQQYGDYRYTLDQSKIHNTLWDVNAEYVKAGKTNIHEEEYEISVEREIPWDAVIAVHQWNGEVFEVRDMPARRSMITRDARRARAGI